MKILIDVPDDDADGRDNLWPIARAVLEAVESGSSRHCLEHLFSGDNLTNGYRHLRLGVRIQIQPEAPPARPQNRSMTPNVSVDIGGKEFGWVFWPVAHPTEEWVPLPGRTYEWFVPKTDPIWEEAR